MLLGASLKQQVQTAFPIRPIVLLLIAAATLGCTPPVQRVRPDTAIQGRSVRFAAIQVNAPFTFRPALYSVTYPAGIYLARFEDAEGVYFPAPEPLVAQTLAGTKSLNGGLYVLKNSWSGFRAYVEEGGANRKFDIPAEVNHLIIGGPR